MRKMKRKMKMRKQRTKNEDEKTENKKMRKMNIWKKGPPVCSLPGRAECCGERPLWEGEEVRGEVRQ